MKYFQLLIATLMLQWLDLSEAVPTASPKASLPSQRDSKHLRPVLEKRQQSGFDQGQPFDGKGKGGPISGIVLDVLAIINPLTVSRRNEQSARSTESRQPWPGIHGCWSGCESEMELLRLPYEVVEWRLGSRTGYYRSTCKQ